MDIDEDMIHVLAALLGESTAIFQSTYQKQLDRLVDSLHKNKNTIESQVDRANLPIFIK